MKFYIVNVDGNGAYVDSGYTSSIWSHDKVNWIAVFHAKDTAQGYVDYLNTKFSIEELKTFVR